MTSRHRRRGRPAKLDGRALAPVERALLRPPRESGFPLERWSLAAACALISRETGVRYNPRHVSRLLRRLGWFVPPFGTATNGGLRRRVSFDPDGNPIGLLESGQHEG